METNQDPILKFFIALFKQSFIKNCQLENEEATLEELQTLEELDPEEVYENMRDLLTDLLKFKQGVKNTEKQELVERAEKLETYLQKLEGEVRTHIRFEQELKIYIEGFQEKLDRAEKTAKSYEAEIKKLETQLTEKENQISQLTKKKSPSKRVTSRLKSCGDFNQEDYRINTNRESPGTKQKPKLKSKRTEDYSKLKTMLEEKNKECDSLRKVFNRVNKQLLNLRHEKSNLKASSRSKLEIKRAQYKATNKRHVGSLQDFSAKKNLESALSNLKRTNSSIKPKKSQEDSKRPSSQYKPMNHLRSFSDNFN
mgnify:FL=1